MATLLHFIVFIAHFIIIRPSEPHIAELTPLHCQDSLFIIFISLVSYFLLIVVLFLSLLFCINLLLFIFLSFIVVIFLYLLFSLFLSSFVVVYFLLSIN